MSPQRRKAQFHSLWYPPLLMSHSRAQKKVANSAGKYEIICVLLSSEMLGQYDPWTLAILTLWTPCRLLFSSGPSQNG